MIFRKYRGWIVDHLPYFIRRRIIYKYRLKIPYYRKIQKELVQRIAKQSDVSVLFIVSSLSMWKYEELLNILVDDSRFKVNIILYPFNSYSENAKKKSIRQLLNHFSTHNCNIVDATNIENLEDLFNSINPQIIFYPMPYEGIYNNNALEYTWHTDRLLCYIPYGMDVTLGDLFYNTPFHNIAWRIFTANSLTKNVYIKGSFSRGENVAVVGEGNTERFRNLDQKSHWKKDGEGIKKIIWAPHYSILDGHALHRTGFVWLYDFMLNIEKEYDGRLQVAFKPHPKLKTLMYEHPEWGKEKTDAYFEAWENGENTIVEEGDYSALFATSDAMIHDSDSFIGEYMYTEKPVMFTCRDIMSIRNEHNVFGNACLDLHYHASSLNQVREFINSVVFCGKDTLKEERHRFYNEILSINDGLTSGQRIYNELIRSLGWK